MLKSEGSESSKLTTSGLFLLHLLMILLQLYLSVISLCPIEILCKDASHFHVQRLHTAGLKSNLAGVTPRNPQTLGCQVSAGTCLALAPFM